MCADHPAREEWLAVAPFDNEAAAVLFNLAVYGKGESQRHKDTKRGAGESDRPPKRSAIRRILGSEFRRVEQAMTLDAVMVVIRAMPVEERKRLIGLIVDSLTESEGSSAGQPHRLLDYEGAGAELWMGVDIQAYLNGLRDEWDRRS